MPVDTTTVEPVDGGLATAEAHTAGEIRNHLERAGQPIGLADVLIAASARVHNLILVTRNVGEFQRLAGLKVEDWFARPPA